MQFGCSKGRPYSSLPYTSIFSLVDIARHMTSLYLGEGETQLFSKDSMVNQT
jgi:hypothetical protein